MQGREGLSETVPRMADRHPGDRLCVGPIVPKEPERSDCLGESDGGQETPGWKFRGRSTREHMMDRLVSQSLDGAFGRGHLRGIELEVRKSWTDNVLTKPSSDLC